jgi:hypothetical protein
LARLSILLLLVNVFVCVGFWWTEILLVTLASSLLGLAGLIIGYKAKHKIRRKGGRVSGEQMAIIGYWGNLVVFVLASLFFAYAVAMGVLRGDLL